MYCGLHFESQMGTWKTAATTNVTIVMLSKVSIRLKSLVRYCHDDQKKLSRLASGSHDSAHYNLAGKEKANLYTNSIATILNSRIHSLVSKVRY